MVAQQARGGAGRAGRAGGAAPAAAAAPARGPAAPNWQAQLLQRGWGYAMLNTASIQADSGCGLTVGIIGLMNKGQPRKMDDWGTLRALAWGADRAMDYFETDKAVDAKRVGVEGHSRWGKATLVTMAYDERFAIGYVSSSGEGGAKLHRRKFGEVIENVNATNEYHWMAGNFMKYGGRWDALPVDSHQLVAMVAPRPLFLSAGSGPLTNPDGTYQLMTADDPRCQANRGPCATQPVNIMDAWVDAKGTFLAGVGADPVYRLLGKQGLGTTEFPKIETGLMDGDAHVPAARRWAHRRAELAGVHRIRRPRVQVDEVEGVTAPSCSLLRDLNVGVSAWLRRVDRRRDTVRMAFKTRSPLSVSEHDDCDAPAGEILLVTHVLVSGDEHIEALGLRRAEQCAVLQGGPSLFVAVLTVWPERKARRGTGVA